MLQDIVSIGDKIELYKHSNKELDSFQSKRHLSKLLDFKGLYEACIAMPIENGKIYPLVIGDKYRICYYTKVGIYQCLCEVKDRYRSGNIFIAVVEMKSELEKFQRRQFYRLSCVNDLRYSLLSEVEEQKETSKIEKSNRTFQTAIMIDISGGGCKFNCNELIMKDKKLIVSFNLKSAKGIYLLELFGQVIYSEAVSNRKDTYEHRVEFLDIKEEERESIVRFIFDEERRRRRKEKGLN